MKLRKNRIFQALLLSILAFSIIIVSASCSFLKGDKGDPGDKGESGERGYSAYEIAVQNGFTGTIGEWLYSLRGQDGADGQSAYDLALAQGFDGTLEDWLNSLKGKDGKNGLDGASLYQLAIDNGFTGSYEEWIEQFSLQLAQEIDRIQIKVVGITVDDRQHLIVRYSDGTSADAGFIGTNETQETTDAAGFRSVYETVVCQTNSLNIRSTPESGSSDNIVGWLTKGESIVRIGVNEETQWSRVLYHDRICYIKSTYVEPLPQYGSDDFPVVFLAKTIYIPLNTEITFQTSSFINGLPDNMSVSYSYSGNCTYNDNGITVLETEAGARTMSVSIKGYKSGEFVTYWYGECSVIATPAEAVAKTGLVIGDSRISDGTLIGKLAQDFPNINWIGTASTSAGVKHEGRGGWSAVNFQKSANAFGTQNPFYNPDSSGFDFDYYLTQNGFEMPDFVIINLGANDGYTQESVAAVKTMVESIRLAAQSRSKQVSVFIMTEYLTVTKGYEVASGSSKDVIQTRDQQLKYYEKQDKTFGDQQENGIYLVSNYLVINETTDWYRGSETVVKDLVHLGIKGYQKEALILGAYLSEFLS